MIDLLLMLLLLLIDLRAYLLRNVGLCLIVVLLLLLIYLLIGFVQHIL